MYAFAYVIFLLYLCSAKVFITDANSAKRCAITYLIISNTIISRLPKNPAKFKEINSK